MIRIVEELRLRRIAAIKLPAKASKRRWGRLDLEVSQTMPDRPPHSYRAIVPWWHRGNPAVTGKDGIGASRTIELNLE